MNPDTTRDRSRCWLQTSTDTNTATSATKMIIGVFMQSPRERGSRRRKVEQEATEGTEKKDMEH
jgi:hypothetical protein